MTPTALDRTAAGLLAAIVAQPDEDMPRLAYAEWLDEQPTRHVTCSRCDGAGKIPGPLNGSFCGHCRTTGSVVDRSDADRAKFIRLQVELAKWDERTLQYFTTEAMEELRSKMSRLERGGNVHEMVAKAHPIGSKRLREHYDRRDHLNRRCTELLALHSAAWSAAPCPECQGEGWVEGISQYTSSVEKKDCPTCCGSCDLLKTLKERHGGQNGYTIYASRILHWRRGFPIVGASLGEWGAEVEEQYTVPGVITFAPLTRLVWQPTPLARHVARLPGVAGLWVTDREPTKEHAGERPGISYDWRNADEMSEGDRAEAAPAVLPGLLFHVVKKGQPHGLSYCEFESPELAHTALARSLMVLTKQAMMTDGEAFTAPPRPNTPNL